MPAAFVAAAAAIGGALISSDASHSAANKQQDAANNATALQKQQYDQTRTDNMPALNARNASLSRLQDLLGISGNTHAAGYGSLGGPINPGDVANSPGYQFGLKQGQTTLNNQEVARGMSNSGQALKAALQYGTDYATTKYDDAFNREVANRSAQLNPLQSAAGLGQTGASTIAASGSNFANQAGQNAIGAGNAQAAATMATGNAISNGINQYAGWYSANHTPSSGGSMYGGGGSGYYDQNGSDTGGFTLSDRRLKTNIVPVGLAPNGLPIYAYKYIWGGRTQIGHMAQEVMEQFPEAVSANEDGFLMVNYSKV